MAYIQDIIFKQSIVYIVNRDTHIVCRACGFPLSGIHNVYVEDTSDVLLQYLVSGCLKIHVNGQIQVIPRLRLSPGYHFLSTAHIIHIDFLISFITLECGLHDLLQS